MGPGSVRTWLLQRLSFQLHVLRPQCTQTTGAVLFWEETHNFEVYRIGWALDPPKCLCIRFWIRRQDSVHDLLGDNGVYIPSSRKFRCDLCSPNCHTMCQRSLLFRFLAHPTDM